MLFPKEGCYGWNFYATPESLESGDSRNGVCNGAAENSFSIYATFLFVVVSVWYTDSVYHGSEVLRTDITPTACRCSTRHADY